MTFKQYTINFENPQETIIEERTPKKKGKGYTKKIKKRYYANRSRNS